MNATVGVAVATLLVVGGILAGPSILECSRDSNGFGACLRDKVAQSGLIAPDTERTERHDVVADLSSEAPAPPAAPAGWMEANANEYEPPASASVDLTGTPADIAAVELVPVSEAPVEVAIVPPMELATGIASPEEPTASIVLDGAELGLVAEGTSSSEAPPPAEVALVAPPGDVTALGPVPATPADAVTALTGGDALIAEGAEIDEPVTEVSPEPTPVELQAATSIEPVPVPPVVVEYNPQYPNVLVLPAPTAGDDSSFRSLQLN